MFITGQRIDLQAILEGFCPNVYFQPPENLRIQYPCIVYQRYNSLTSFADNLPFRHSKRYQVTIIDRDPDSSIFDMVAGLPMCLHNRFFVANNLNHDVFNLYY